MTVRTDTAARLGLYVHIPYCRALCHYCDFAKTANFAADHPRRYVERLVDHWRAWQESELVAERLAGGLSSVFLGGGTPSLFSDAYAPLMAAVVPHLQLGAEVSLEANPDDITEARLRTWRGLGFTRLSIGVQTFAAAGLKRLQRIHDGAAAVAAITMARDFFPNLNVDLIYGWPEQTLDDWEADLAQVLKLGVSHLSLYNLTYEGRTPMARAVARQRLAPIDDDVLATFYQTARERLGAAGFLQEEVSNWSKPGSSCVHNWLYWEDQSYVGLGAGAHGYFAASDGPGLRYAYDRSDRRFLGNQPATLARKSLDEAFGITSESERGIDDWLTERLATALRQHKGLDLGELLRRTGRRLVPSPILAEGLAQGLLTLQGGNCGKPLVLTLSPEEWFRESSWGLQVLKSLKLL